MAAMTNVNIIIKKMRVFKVLSLMLLSLFFSCHNRDKRASSVTATEQTDSICLYLASDPVDTNDIFTCVSEDGSMKFSSWDTGMGGTCPDYAVICHFRGKDGETVTVDFCERECDPAWVSAVHSIKKDDGSTYYITTRSHRASSNDGYMWMDAFMIDHDTLKNVSVYDAGDDIDDSGLVINYPIAHWYFATNGEGWDWLFEYDAEDRNLYIPQIVYIDESIPVINDRYRVWHFNGKEFVDKGESAHKGLHKSLAHYYSLASYFRTKNHLVRVDQMDYNGAFRYASWKTTSDMSSQPDIVIQGGIYDEEKDTYTFINDGYEYVVGYREGEPIRHEYLLVRKDGKVILKEERC